MPTINTALLSEVCAHVHGYLRRDQVVIALGVSHAAFHDLVRDTCGRILNSPLKHAILDVQLRLADDVAGQLVPGVCVFPQISFPFARDQCLGNSLTFPLAQWRAAQRDDLGLDRTIAAAKYLFLIADGNATDCLSLALSLVGTVCSAFSTPDFAHRTALQYVHELRRQSRSGLSHSRIQLLRPEPDVVDTTIHDPDLDDEPIDDKETVH